MVGLVLPLPRVGSDWQTVEHGFRIRCESPRLPPAENFENLEWYNLCEIEVCNLRKLEVGEARVGVRRCFF